MVYEISRALLEGCHIAIYSYIKPGSVHRLRIDPSASHMMSSCIGITEYIIKAIELGQRVRRGELAATGLDLGRLLGKALREAYRWTSYHPYPDIIIPTITNALILSYVEPDSIIRESGDLRRALSLFIGGTRWRDVREFMNALNSIGRSDMNDHLRSSGLTYSQALVEEVSLDETFRILGSRWPGFLASSPRETILFDLVKKTMEYYRKYRDGNNTAIALYLYIVGNRLPNWAKEEVKKAFEQGLMASKEGSKILFQLDLRIRKQGLGFEEYTPLLAAIMQLAVYEGLRI
ncbi:MAG: hypothetical protein DRO40_06055 [Thermoprotei archaeon]|nr:MAG: hypothetical protein DRO40_06055 [Thermoprotei archaeon]